MESVEILSELERQIASIIDANVVSDGDCVACRICEDHVVGALHTPVCPILKLTDVHRLVTAALHHPRAVTEALSEQRVSDYRSGYSAGWSDGKNGEPMQDAAKAKLFFGIDVKNSAGRDCEQCWQDGYDEGKAALRESQR